ncbi:MAG: hypothetical protein AAF490_32530 [Chloroflexota bacterium]
MIVFTSTYFDPNGRLFTPIQQALPVLTAVFDAITISVSEKSYPQTAELLEQHGVHVIVREERPREEDELPPVGFYRRTAVSHALQAGATHIMLCDLDRAAHWANYFPDELERVVQRLPEKDFWVIGRTERAFYSHPPSMVKTEGIINEVFAKVSGHPWDVVAATRGMSTQAAQFIVETSTDDSFGNDASWPLLILGNGRLSIDYLPIEGMEFETADAFPDEVEQAGGVEAWIAQLDHHPEQWIYRLQAATVEVNSILSALPDK